MVWMGIFAVQRNLKSLCQYQSSETSIFLSHLFIVQLSHPLRVTDKTTVWTILMFVCREQSLHLKIFSSFIHVLPSANLCHIS
uniref:Uncharacterized protein n=1 Tax=Pygocentrus nattereri TaxID=42514 RepID=A0AAR2IWH8_PYGNA